MPIFARGVEICSVMCVGAGLSFWQFLDRVKYTRVYPILLRRRILSRISCVSAVFLSATAARQSLFPVKVSIFHGFASSSNEANVRQQNPWGW